MGVTVTFIALLELMREGLIDVVQTELLAPLHVRRAAPNLRLQLIAGGATPDANLEVTDAT